MKITIKYKELETFYNVLNKSVFKNMKANRGKAKLLNKLTEKDTEYVEFRKDILKNYTELDEKGELKVDENNNFKLLKNVDITKLNNDLQELDNEDVVFESGEYSNRFNDFLEALSESDLDYDTQEIILIDKILDEYESKGEIRKCQK